MKDIDHYMDKLRETNGVISGIRNFPHAEPGKGILKKRSEIELEISRLMIDGASLEDPVLDYCARNFSNNTPKGRDFGLFDAVDNVEKFRNYVNKNVGKWVLTGTHRGFQMIPDFSEIGSISGGVGFEIEWGFRNMYVPVKQIYIAEGDKWVKGGSRNGNAVIASSAFFGYRGNNENEGKWDYSGTGSPYVGATGCDDIGGNLYVGSDEGISRVLNPADNSHLGKEKYGKFKDARISIKGSMALPEN